MNIFVLDLLPADAARYHCDRHVVKMAVESCQILSTALWIHGVAAPYKATHQKHPCVRWAAHCSGNWQWLHSLGVALCAEYTFRYDKTHACEAVLAELRALQPFVDSWERDEWFSRTAFVQAMPVQYQQSNTIDAYRAYYINEKSHIAQWRRRGTPHWWEDHDANQRRTRADGPSAGRQSAH